MTFLILLAATAVQDDSYAPTQIGRGLWKSPAGFIYRSDKLFTGDELRRQEAAAGFDVGPVPPRTEKEIKAAFGGRDKSEWQVSTSRPRLKVHFRPRPARPSFDESRAISLTTQREGEFETLPESDRPVSNAGEGEPPSGRSRHVSYRVPVADRDPVQRADVADTSPLPQTGQTKEPAEATQMPAVPRATFRVPSVVVAIVVCLLVPALLIAFGVNGSSKPSQTVSSTILKIPETLNTFHQRKPDNTVREPTFDTSRRTLIACPYCQTERLSVEPKWRYVRCPVCQEIVELGKQGDPIDHVPRRAVTSNPSLPADSLRQTARVSVADDATEAPKKLSPHEIEARNAAFKFDVLARLRGLDPYEFEGFVGSLLEEIGFDSVEVTEASGDGGVDVRGIYNTAKLFNDRVAIQVKRYGKNTRVGRPEIQALRGSLAPSERGMIITTSDFTEAAVEEACRAGVQEITLMNGEWLLEEMIKNSFGMTWGEDGLLVENETNADLRFATPA